MKILYVTCVHPDSLDYGSGLRNHAFISGLRQQHEVQIAYLPPTAEAAGTIQSANINNAFHILRPNRHDRLRKTVLAQQYSLGFRSRRRFLASFHALERQINPDVVWYFQKYAIRLTGFPQSVPAVIDFDEVPWRKMLQQSRYSRLAGKPSLILKAALSRAEDLRISQRASILVHSNSQEQRLLCSQQTPMLLPNGFDFTENNWMTRSKKLPRILFFGLLSYYPNLDGINWFCENVWPRIITTLPDVQLDIVGQYQQLPDTITWAVNTNIHGFVENLDEIIQSSRMLIVPLRIGSGTRLKILEAWAKGLPVVTTSLGCEGLNAEHGKTALIADSADDFARACLTLLDQPDLGVELAANALHHGREHFDWQKIYPALDDILARATQHRVQSAKCNSS